MFKNIGAKIKGLAKFIFWVMSIASVIAGVFIIIQGLGNTHSDGTTKLMAVLAGLGVSVGGVILAWLENFLLYGFGWSIIYVISISLGGVIWAKKRRVRKLWKLPMNWSLKKQKES